MALDLVTGHGGGYHVSSADAAGLNMGLLGMGSFCFSGTSETAGKNKHQSFDYADASPATAAKIVIEPGDAMFDGRHVHNDGPVEMALEVPQAGTNRTDVICIRYTMDTNGVEDCYLVSVQGRGNAGTAELPQAGDSASPAPIVLTADGSADKVAPQAYHPCNPGWASNNYKPWHIYWADQIFVDFPLYQLYYDKSKNGYTVTKQANWLAASFSQNAFVSASTKGKGDLTLVTAAGTHFKPDPLQIVKSPLGVDQGGTGEKTIGGIKTLLGIPSLPVSVKEGGTQKQNLNKGYLLFGNGTGAIDDAYKNYVYGWGSANPKVDVFWKRSDIEVTYVSMNLMHNLVFLAIAVHNTASKEIPANSELLRIKGEGIVPTDRILSVAQSGGNTQAGSTWTQYGRLKRTSDYMSFAVGHKLTGNADAAAYFVYMTDTPS